MPNTQLILKKTQTATSPEEKKEKMTKPEFVEEIVERAKELSIRLIDADQHHLSKEVDRDAEGNPIKDISLELFQEEIKPLIDKASRPIFDMETEIPERKGIPEKYRFYSPTGELRRIATSSKASQYKVDTSDLDNKEPIFYAEPWGLFNRKLIIARKKYEKEFPTLEEAHRIYKSSKHR